MIARRAQTRGCTGRVGKLVVLLVASWSALAITRARLARADEPPAPNPAPSKDSPLFERDVVPILTAHCFKCHGFEARKSSLDLRTVALMLRGGEGGPVLVPGDLEKSRLYARVADRSMPPQGELPLTDAHLEILRKWVASGAAARDPSPQLTDDEAPLISEQDRQFWAFRPVQRPSVPTLADGTAVANPADAFLRSTLQSHGLDYSARADAATAVRRLYLDLTGLPPSPADLDAFIASASGSGGEAAWEQLVDRLLASPQFGERWGRHWLDTAGYVDVFGSDNDAAIIKLWENKWLYRDYVVRAFNADKPFDRFLKEQLAGDELVDWRGAEKFTPEIKELLVATGYLRAAIDDTAEKELNTALIRFRVLHLTMDVVGTGLLGLTTGCARCHTHKFEPIPHRDYYRLLAIFTPAYNPQAWVTVDQRFLPDVSPAEQKQIESWNAELDTQIQPHQDELTRLEAVIRQRLVEQKLAGVPEPIRADTQAALATLADQRTEIQKYLASKFEALLTVKPEEIAPASNDAERARIAELNQHMAALRAQKKSWGKLPVLWDVDKPSPTYLLKRGDHETPGPEVEPGFLSVLCATDAEALAKDVDASGPTSRRRTAFANWLTNPTTAAGGLVARVQVNRIWQHLFGQGIVSTTENLGHSGTPPTHPELLDWLAAEFMANGWHFKPIIRLLVTSDAYRQASTRQVPEGSPSVAAEQPDPELIDPANQWLWRMRLRRMESEVIRDSMLATSGKIDLTLGGPPIPLENLPDGMVVLNEKQLTTPNSKFRRSIYVLARRNYHLSILNEFDQPTVATNCTRRASSAVVLQSLMLLNDTFVLEQSRFFAERVLAANPAAARADQARLAFRMAIAREPDAEECQAACELIERQQARYLQQGQSETDAALFGLANLCQTLLASNEFLYVE